jgi:hypothetical protein
MGGMRKLRSCELHRLEYYFSEIARVAVIILQSGIRCISVKQYQTQRQRQEYN